MPTSILQKINRIIDLYEDRKITQLTTAENLIKGIATNNEKQRAKGLKEYEKRIEKYESATPAGERMAKTAEKARDARTVKTVRTKIVGKTKASVASRLTKAVANRGFGQQKSYSIKYMLFTTNEGAVDDVPNKKVKPAFKVDGMPYFPLFAGRDASKYANIKATPFIETLVNRKITEQRDKPLFKKVMMFLKRDFDVKNALIELLNYTDAIKIYKVNEAENAEDYDIDDEGLRDTTNISIYNFYHETLVDTERETVKEAIQNDNYRDNECWINHLLETYEGTELTREKRSSQAKTLSRKKILELLKTTEEDIHEYGISINNMKKVFQYFSIPVKLYNYQCQLIFEYMPDKRKHDGKRIFTALIKNNHIYPINANQDRLCHLNGEASLDFKASKNFYITDMTEPPKYKMFSHINELLKLTEHDEYYLIHKENNMIDVLYQLKKVGYEPYIRYKAGRISDLRIKFRYKKLNKSVVYNVSTQDLSKDTLERDIDADTEEKYNRIAEAMFNFNKKLFSSSHMSQYDDVDIEILDECRTVVPLGYLDKNIDVNELVEIDRTKAFTWAFNQITSIPIFNAFDSWKAWDGTLDINKLSSLTLYKVEVLKGNMFFNKKFNIIYGKFLRKMDLSNIKIIYYKIPSYIHKVNYKSIVDELWETPLGTDEEDDKQIKKKIANINFGMLEKSNNTAQRSVIFNSLKEACHYQRKHGGRIYALDEERHEEEQIHKGNTYYVLNTTDRQTLVNGYRYIKQLLLDYHNFAMYEAYNKLIAKGVKVYSVKSDSFTIHQDDLSKVKPNPNHFIKSYREGILNFETGIGNWRVSTSRINFPTEKYKFKYNKLIPIPLQENEALDVIDEWDTEAVCKQIIPNSPCMIRGKLPGTGKSYIAEHFSKLGYKVVFVVPTNQLLQEKLKKGLEATTFNKFFAIPVEGDKGEKLAEYDHSPFDVVCFDEVYMANTYIKNKIRLFVKNHSNKKIIVATGDTKQLQGVESITNCQDPATYADHCLDVIFKHNIFLKICKRVGAKDSPDGDKNRQIINDMYDDCWVNKLSVSEMVEKHGKMTDDIMTSEYNIAYTNSRCLEVSNAVRKGLGKTDKYEVGDELVCRLYYRSDGGEKFNLNILFKILCIKSSCITIQNMSTNTKHTTTEEILRKHFRFAHCITCHSAQGASVSKTITIHEWDKPHLVSREWFWCAITRCVDFNNVRFFKSNKFENEINENLLRRYFQNKIDGYKRQDKKSKREINEENYIDVEWCMSRLKGCCGKCGCKFEIEREKGQISSNFSAQRLCNLHSHTKDNCDSWCVYCNCSAK